jgi:pathogenesis-related protein 1
MRARVLGAVGLVFCAAAGAQEPVEFSGMIEAHNAWRRIVHVPELRWSTEAAQFAQNWANQLAAQGCEARYNPDPQRKEHYGENVFKAWASEPYPGWRRTPQQIVDKWGEEGRFYDLATNLCNAPSGRICGHYVQLTWDETQVVGCGRARCEKAEVWVCDYTPRGNKPGERPYGGTHKKAEFVPEPSPEAQLCYAEKPSLMSPID